MSLGYRMIRAVARVVVALQMRVKVTGAEDVPRTGALLFVSNHLGLTDQLAIGVPLVRELHILAKADIFEWPILGWLARRAGTIPIRRGDADRAALRSARDLLRDDACVLIFPEGTFVDPRKPVGMATVKTGAAWLAQQADAKIVPVAITGTELVWSPTRGWRPWRRPQVNVIFGEPYLPDWPGGMSSKAAWRTVADEMARRIASLLPEEYRGVYRSPVEGSYISPTGITSIRIIDREVHER